MWAGQSAGEKGHGDKSKGWARRGGAECGGKPELASRRAAREDENLHLVPSFFLFSSQLLGLRHKGCIKQVINKGTALDN